jgi:hypothetical protein
VPAAVPALTPPPSAHHRGECRCQTSCNL